MARPLLALAATLSTVLALDNGLALTPQMGWNTWNHFGCDISEDTILGAANAIIDNKLNELGYGCESPSHVRCMRALTVHDFQRRSYG